jgi:hypothetical protein
MSSESDATNTTDLRFRKQVSGVGLEHRCATDRDALRVSHSLAAAAAEAGFDRVDGLATLTPATAGVLRVSQGKWPGWLEAWAEEQARDAAEKHDDEPEDEEEGRGHDGGDDDK